MMLFIKYLLIFLSFIYGLVIQLRNKLYDWGIKRTFHWETKIISVGNLTLGGTGKTPLIIYLVNVIQNHHLAKEIGVISRGYKRKTKGFRIANQYDVPITIGDESYQLYQRFGKYSNVTIAVAEQRRMGILHLLKHNTKLSVILLDDAFQHRSVQPHLNILLTDFNAPFFKDKIIPIGRLREHRREINRADMVIVTKCPVTLTKEKRQYVEQQVNLYSMSEKQEIPIFYSTIAYKKPVAIFSDLMMQGTFKYVLLVTAIASVMSLVQHIKTQYHLVDHLIFQDHHIFTYKDIINMIKRFNTIPYHDKFILTTEKDQGKMLHCSWKGMLQQLPIFYIPIDVQFSQKRQFDQCIASTLL